MIRSRDANQPGSLLHVTLPMQQVTCCRIFSWSCCHASLGHAHVAQAGWHRLFCGFVNCQIPAPKAQRQSAVALILDLVHKTVRFLAPDAAVLRLCFSHFRSPCVTSAQLQQKARRRMACILDWSACDRRADHFSCGEVGPSHHLVVISYVDPISILYV